MELKQVLEHRPLQINQVYGPYWLQFILLLILVQRKMPCSLVMVPATAGKLPPSLAALTKGTGMHTDMGGLCVVHMSI